MDSQVQTEPERNREPGANEDTRQLFSKELNEVFSQPRVNDREKDISKNLGRNQNETSLEFTDPFKKSDSKSTNQATGGEQQQNPGSAKDKLSANQQPGQQRGDGHLKENIAGKDKSEQPINNGLIDDKTKGSERSKESEKTNKQPNSGETRDKPVGQEKTGLNNSDKTEEKNTKTKVKQEKFGEAELAKAVDLAKENRLPLVAYVGGQSCKLCPAASANFEKFNSKTNTADESKAIVVKITAETAHALLGKNDLNASLLRQVLGKDTLVPRVAVFNPNDMSKPLGKATIGNWSEAKLNSHLNTSMEQAKKVTSKSEPQDKAATPAEEDKPNVESSDAAKSNSNSFKAKTAKEAEDAIKESKEKNLPLVVHAPTGICTDTHCSVEKLDKSIPGKFAGQAIFLELPRGGVKLEGGEDPSLSKINEQFKVTEKDHKTSLDLHVYQFDKSANPQMQQLDSSASKTRSGDYNKYIQSILNTKR